MNPSPIKTAVLVLTTITLLATLLVTPVGAVASGRAAMSLDIDGLYREPSLIGTKPRAVEWSPDSSRIAFLWNESGGEHLDVWTWAPGQQAPARLARRDEGTSPAGGIASVTWARDGSGALLYVVGDTLWLQAPGSNNPAEIARGQGLRLAMPSPNGQHLAWVSSEGLWLSPWPVRAGAAQLVLPLEDPALRIGTLEWAANGSKLAFMLTDQRPLPERTIHYETREGHQALTVRRAFPGDDTAHYRVGIVEPEAAKVRFLERPDERDYVWNLGISSDRSRLFINGSDLLIKHHRIDMYDLASGERTVFYEEHDPLHLRPDWRAAWAPGDRGLVILTDRDGFLHLYHQADAQATPRALTSGEWEISTFWTDADSEQVYFLANRDHPASKQLYRVSMDGGPVEPVTGSMPGTHVPFLSPDRRHAVTLFSNDRIPHDLYHVDLGTLKTSRITRSPHPDFDRQNWAEVRYVEFPSRVDGARLIGRLSLPPGFDETKRYPLIVGSVYSDSVLNQWGGRQSHPTWGLDQFLVARGYILLNVNIRGSWGQGRKHNQGLRHGYGIVDIEDLHSGVEYLVREGIADPVRVGIWGSSYGGLMTTMSLFKKPGVYAAGIAGAPATNVAHAYPGQMWVMGEPTGEDQPQRYQAQSPLYHTAGLADPLMIIHGTRDQVVLYSDTIAVVQHLVEQEKPFELVTLPGVGHGWDNEAPEVRRFAFKKMVEFFDRHLGRSSR